MERIEIKEIKYKHFFKFFFSRVEINKINNSVNATGNTLSTLAKLNPLKILSMPIRKISIRLEPRIDFKTKINSQNLQLT